MTCRQTDRRGGGGNDVTNSWPARVWGGPWWRRLSQHPRQDPSAVSRETCLPHHATITRLLVQPLNLHADLLRPFNEQSYIANDTNW